MNGPAPISVVYQQILFTICQRDLRYEMYGNFEVHETTEMYTGVCRACREVVVAMSRISDVVNAIPLMIACIHLRERCRGGLCDFWSSHVLRTNGFELVDQRPAATRRFSWSNP